MQRDGFYGNGLGGFPLMDAPGSSVYRTPASRAPQGCHQDLTSYGQDRPQSQNQEAEDVQSSPATAHSKSVVPASSGGDANRAQLDLPPVVGSTIQYSNKLLKHRPIPDDVEEIRDKLFHLNEDVLLDSQQIADYWLHMSNVWQRSTKPSLEDNGVVVEMFECRNRRRVKMVGKDRQSTGTRNRGNKDDLLGDLEPCKLRVSVQSFTKHAEGLKEPCRVGFMSCNCIPEWAYICRTTATKEKKYVHQHEISLSDRYKRSDAILYFCKLKVTELYSYPAVLKWLKEKYGHITPQVNYVSKQDIANVSRPWRLLNKDVELRQQVEEETDWEQQRRACLDSIGSISAPQLVKALVAVCTQMPQAIDLVLPFLEKAASPESQADPIKTGADIVIPPPGCPVAKQYTTSNYKGQILTPEEVAERTRAQQAQTAPTQPPPPSLQHASPHNRVPNPHGGSAEREVRNQFGHSLRKQPDPRRPGHFLLATTDLSHVPVQAPPHTGAVPYKAPTRGHAGGSQVLQRAMTTTWLSSSASHPMILRNHPGVAEASTADSRPSWALPVAKRPASMNLEKSEPKRQLVDDIATQLNKELEAGTT